MKKFLSMMLTTILVLSMSTVAFAATTDSTAGKFTDEESITITKEYVATHAGTTSPKETFGFTIERGALLAEGGEKVYLKDAAVGVTSENMPLPTIASVEYNAGAAGNVNPEDPSTVTDYDVKDYMTQDITITLPGIKAEDSEEEENVYAGVGVYYYTIKEIAGTTAGVTYYDDEIILVVTVIQDSAGKIRVAAVHTEEADSDEKSDEFANVYSAGSLVVSKEVTGNLGDQTKDFTVTVTFTAPEGKTVNEAISYVDGTASKTISVSDWENGSATATITLKHDESVTFTNIPYGVTYNVMEDDYSGDGYDAPKYSVNAGASAEEDEGVDEKADSASDTVKITNNKGVEVDTGITLDSAPYMMMLIIAAAGIAFFLAKKRRYTEN